MTLNNFPTVRPAQTLDFAKSRYLPPEVTFSRATPATNGSDGTYVGPDGSVTVSDKDTPRFTRQNGKSMGLLIEPARTNYAHDSSSLDTDWDDTIGSSNRAIDAGTTIAPSGVDEALHLGCEVGANAITNCFFSYGYFNLPSNDNYGVSVFVKQTPSVDNNIQWFRASFTGGMSYACCWDWNTLDYDQTSKDNLNLIAPEYYGNGWWRIGAWFTVTDASVIGYVAVGLGDTDNNGNRTQPNRMNTNGGYFYGFQIELGSDVSSYIPSPVGATATRAADTAEISSAVTGGAIISKPFGAAIGGSALNFGTAGGSPIERVDLYTDWLPYQQTAALADVDDGFWRFRVLGADFALVNFEFENSGTPGAFVQVDWGDGSPLETLTTATHTFIDHAGYHDVGFRVIGGTWFNPRINNNSANKDKIVAVGPMPLGMFTVGDNTFRECINLVSVGNLAFLPASDIFQTFEDCTALTVVPLFDTSEVLDFREIFKDATSIIELPPFDTSSCTAMRESFRAMTSLQSFPYIDTSKVETLFGAWDGCSSLASFPVLDFSAVDEAKKPWRGCSSLTSFPTLNMDYCKNFKEGWKNCTSLVDFPAGFFDTWSRTPTNECFYQTWDGCSALSATSVEHILDSLATADQNAPTGSGFQVTITIDYDTGTGVPYGGTLSGGVITPTPASITTLKGKTRPWIIVLNGVTQ